MRKTICDVCGKEITNTNPYEFCLGRKINVRGLDDTILNGYSIICQDVCEDCADSIYHYIKGLQKYRYIKGLQKKD